MTARARAAIALCLGISALGSAPARAGVDLGEIDACVAAAMAAGQPATACVDAAHAACMETPDDAPAVAGLCFLEAKDAWSAGIADLMAVARDTAPEDLAAVLAIEVKYDLLGGLLQCDRLDELAHAVGNQAAEQVRMQKTRCEAVAAGLAYTRLRARIETLE